MRSLQGLKGFLGLGVGVCLLGLAVTAWAQRAGPQANGDATPPSVLSLGEPTSVVRLDSRLTQFEDARQRYEAIRSGLMEVDSAGNLQPRRARRSVNSAASNRMLSGAPLVLFGSTGNQGATLITIDPATGAGTAVVAHGEFGPVTDIDCSPASVMYGGTGGGSGNLITIDPASDPAESLVGLNGLGVSANIALEWVGSTLYGIVIFGPGGCRTW